ncbi:MAG: response regulator [Mucilaginibacter sp.]
MINAAKIDTVNSFMLVDDDSINNMLCTYLIEDAFENADIESFEKPLLALDAIKNGIDEPGKNAPTVLFLDINMPMMSGWDFLDVYKDFSDNIHKRFTIYILSSSVDHRDEERAINNPLVAGFLSKPLDADYFKQMLDNAKQ